MTGRSLIKKLAALLTRQRSFHFQASIPEDIRRGQIRHVFSKGGGLGDELMAVSVLQAASHQHPEWKFIYHTRYMELFRGLPGAHDVVSYVPDHLPRGILRLAYAGKNEHSLNSQMALQLGIIPNQYSIHLPLLPGLETGVKKSKAGKHVVVQPGSSGWTPNKQWPVEFWVEFIESLPADWTIVEVGTDAPLQPQPKHPGFQSVAERTSLLGYVECIHQADGFVGPPSSGMHLAHAFNIPSVIVTGGYEAAHYPYPLARQLGSKLPCAPCWLMTPCPYDRRCLREISPQAVRQALLEMMNVIQPL